VFVPNVNTPVVQMSSNPKAYHVSEESLETQQYNSVNRVVTSFKELEKQLNEADKVIAEIKEIKAKPVVKLQRAPIFNETELIYTAFINSLNASLISSHIDAQMELKKSLNSKINNDVYNEVPDHKTINHTDFSVNMSKSYLEKANFTKSNDTIIKNTNDNIIDLKDIVVFLNTSQLVNLTNNNIKVISASIQSSLNNSQEFIVPLNETGKSYPTHNDTDKSFPTHNETGKSYSTQNETVTTSSESLFTITNPTDNMTLNDATFEKYENHRTSSIMMDSFDKEKFLNDIKINSQKINDIQKAQIDLLDRYKVPLPKTHALLESKFKQINKKPNHPIQKVLTDGPINTSAMLYNYI
jgi:hypothetical protein